VDTKFRSSFIPKNSVVMRSENHEGGGFFRTFSALIFVVALIITGSLFVYSKMLSKNVENLRSQIVTSRAAIDSKSIAGVLAFEKKLDSIQSILDNHIAFSEYFKMLEENTVSQVAWQDLRYNGLAGGNFVVEMSGRASSFSAIALQEESFLQDQNIKFVSFDNLKLDPKNGAITFSFRAEIGRDLIKFKLPQ